MSGFVRYAGKSLWITSCAVAMLCQTGCVYRRLDRFRAQLSAFPDNFRIEEGKWPTIRSLDPVLRPDDFGWLSGLSASDVADDNGGITETYRFVKHHGDPADERPGQYDIRLAFRFNARDRMEAVRMPPQFASVLTEANFDEVFRPMKDGVVEPSRHATGWWWEEHRVHLPVRKDIILFFGLPYAVEETPEGKTYRYAYRLEGNEQQWNPTGWAAYARFDFGGEDERVVFSEFHMGRLRIVVDLRDEKNHVDIERLGKRGRQGR